MINEGRKHLRKTDVAKCICAALEKSDPEKRSTFSFLKPKLFQRCFCLPFFLGRSPLAKHINEDPFGFTRPLHFPQLHHSGEFSNICP